MARLNEQRRKKVQPSRMKHAIEKLSEIDVEFEKKDETLIEIKFKGCIIKFFPFTGWHTGKTIDDGRGLENLLKQLK